MNKIFFTFYFVANAALAADWQVAAVTDKSVSFVDKNSISIVPPYKKAWTKYVYKNKQVVEGTHPVKQYQSSVNLQFVDCNARTIAIKQEVLYMGGDREGETISSKSWPILNSSFEDVVPESVGESILEYICTNSPSSNQ